MQTSAPQGAGVDAARERAGGMETCSIHREGSSISWKVGPAACACATSKTKLLRQYRGIRRIGTQRSRGPAQWPKSPHVPSASAGQLRAVRLQYFQSSSATGRQEQARQRLVPRSAVSPRAHQTHENSRDRTRTQMGLPAEYRQGNPMLQSGSVERAPPSFSGLSRRQAAKHRLQKRRNRVLPSRLHLSRCPRRFQAQSQA